MFIPRRYLRLALLAVVYTPIHSYLLAQSDADLSASIKTFTEVYQAVETNFADRVDPDNMVFKGAIPTMLRTLDPHSNFFDPKAYQLMRENQAGHYYGVGMYVGSPERKVLVMYPFEGSPAYRAGIRPGDQIVAVNDTNTERSTVNQVSSMLKGPKGTPVTITVNRLGEAAALHFSVVRDNVPRGSVNYAFWLRPGIAYMRIEAFNETTGREVDQALAKFPESAIEGLILDIRDNGGGLVQEAVNVADRFLRKGQLIVAPRAGFGGNQVRRKAWRARARVSHHRDGQPRHRLGRRNSVRRPAGPRSRLDLRREDFRQGIGASPLHALR